MNFTVINIEIIKQKYNIWIRLNLSNVFLMPFKPKTMPLKKIYPLLFTKKMTVILSRLYLRRN